ncbi:MAG: NHL repeat-containing protein, partial [Bacteroidota bacterium]
MTLRLLLLSITLWCASLAAQTCNGLYTITLSSSNQCLDNSPKLKVAGAKYASKIEWYCGTNLIGTTNIKADNTIGKTVAGDSTGVASGELTRLNWPWGVVVDPNDDSIYVSDYNNYRVMKWKEGSIKGNLFSGVTGVHNQSPGYFYRPTGLSMSSLGALYVSDYDNHKIQKFAAGSRASSSVIVAGNASSGGGYSNLTCPFGSFVDKDTIYVADAYGGGPITGYAQNTTWGNRVMKWIPNASAGQVVAGTYGNAGGKGVSQLNYPTGVYVNKNGDIYVADFANSRIQKWARGATQGITVADLSTIGTNKSAVFPTDIWIDENTNTMYMTASNQICDFEFLQFSGKDNYVIQWGAEGSSNYTVLNTGTLKGNKLYTPSSLFLTPNGSIYVVDRGNNRVQAWTKSIDTTFTPTTYGNYTAKIYNTAGCSVVSNVVPIDSAYSPSVSISATPSVDICSGTTVTFSALPKNGVVAPSYQWTKNGTNIAGAISSTYSFSPSNGNIIACVMTANNVCKTNTPTVTSNTITTSIIPDNTPSVSIVSSSVNNTFCSGTSVTFTASPINGGTNPTYQWMVNNNLIGTNSNAFTSNSLIDKDIVTCQLTRTSGGCTNTPVTNSITVKINQSTTSI